METIYLQDNLKAVVKLERLSDDDADIGHSSTMRKKIGEIFQTSRDHLAFVCIYCAAEFPLFIQFASHIEKHLQEIHSNSIKPATTTFSMDSDFNTINMEPLITLKYELESDEETAHFESTFSDGEPDSHPAHSNIHVHIEGENNATNTNQLNDQAVPAKENQLKVGDTIENITEDDDIRNQIDYESDTQTTQPVNVSSQKNTSNNENIKIFECFECHRVFNTINSRRNCIKHMRLHLTASKKCIYCTGPVLLEKPMACLFCDESILKSRQYYKHGYLRHKLTSEKLNLLRQMCKRCSLKFKCKNLDEKQMELNRLAERHNVLNYSCNVCGKVYRQLDGLKKHMFSHDGGGKFECEICNQSYALNYKLTHMRSHTGEKKFQCSQCGLLCINLSRLNRHIMIHTDERPHECDYCHKFFRKKSLLNNHRRMHTRDYVHYCKSCKKGYTDLSGLRKHNLKSHGIDMERIKKKNILIT